MTQVKIYSIENGMYYLSSSSIENFHEEEGSELLGYDKIITGYFLDGSIEFNIYEKDITVPEQPDYKFILTAGVFNFDVVRFSSIFDLIDFINKYKITILRIASSCDNPDQQ